MPLLFYVQYKSACSKDEQAIISAVKSDYPQYLENGTVHYLRDDPVVDNSLISFMRYEYSSSGNLKTSLVNLSLPSCEPFVDSSSVNLPDFAVSSFVFFAFLLGLVAGLRGHGRTV